MTSTASRLLTLYIIVVILCGAYLSIHNIRRAWLADHRMANMRLYAPETLISPRRADFPSVPCWTHAVHRFTTSGDWAGTDGHYPEMEFCN
jgi:hypothetical protein